MPQVSMTCSAPKEAEANDIGLDAIKANSLLGGREETLLHSDGNDAVRDVFFPFQIRSRWPAPNDICARASGRKTCQNFITKQTYF